MNPVWIVVFHPDFLAEFAALAPAVHDELMAHARLLETMGPRVGRPRVDTLKGSRHANRKELRFDAAGGAWRVAFDPRRRAILLVAGNKSGVGQRRFYQRLIDKADRRFSAHLALVKASRRP
ncbi:MAG: type II toxin-antitoxin system RelE/ParE family toxin [Alphaproteobacteria bacterium]|nr:type II toxin-antitoxin system RelE/ParE family toxin [Alphaproteobacteria bacterium]